MGEGGLATCELTDRELRQEQTVITWRAVRRSAFCEPVTLDERRTLLRCTCPNSTTSGPIMNKFCVRPQCTFNHLPSE